MNKSGLINILCEKTKMPKKKAKDVVDLIFDSMSEALLKDERIEIRGLGSFCVRHYEPYTGRNPRTGESISVPPKKLPFFKTGKELKEFVDGKEPGDEGPETNPAG
jgi:integration host factor subunit beta